MARMRSPGHEALNAKSDNSSHQNMVQTKIVTASEYNRKKGAKSIGRRGFVAGDEILCTTVETAKNNNRLKGGLHLPASKVTLLKK